MRIASLVVVGALLWAGAPALAKDTPQSALAARRRSRARATQW